MARLNEFAASTETVESLKRRFVRQNREIARANSLQSVRVKELEAEVARLLAENVSLREEVISLNQELEKCQGSERVDAGISCIREKLEAKLAEVSNIVSDLGALPRRRPAVIPSQPPPDNADHLVSPTDNHATSTARPTRDAQLGSDLPVIEEDKLYPRLSLRNDGEIDAVGNLEEGEGRVDETQHNESSNFPEDPMPQRLWPDDGFRAVDPQGHDSTHAPESPPSLEVRKKRKRRDSSLIKDIIPKTNFESGDQDIGQSPRLPMAGSKRKFTVSHDEQPSTSHQNDGSDDFQFTRVAELPSRPDSPGSEKMPTQPISKDPNTQPRKKESVKTGRRALESKSTNIAPKSPAKTQANAKVRSAGDKDSHEREPPAKRKRNTKSAITDHSSLLEKRESKTADIHPTNDAYNSPKKAGEVLSHEIPEQKTTFDATRYQKPHSEANENADGLLSDAKPREGVRHPRRSRGPINYAEPNLRVKMRRPAEDPGDAAPGNDSRRVSKSYHDQGSKLDSGEQSTDHENRRTAEESNFDSGEDDASGQKENPPSIFCSDSAESGKVQETPSSAVMSTVDSGMKRRLQDKRRSETVRDNYQHFPIADFEESSTFSDAGENFGDNRDTLKQSRRHSSNPSHNADRASDRKHSETVAAAAANVRQDPNPSGNYKSVNPPQAHQRATHEIHYGSTQMDSGGGRTQRLGTRRRSTMV